MNSEAVKPGGSLLGRLAMGLFCSAVITLLMNLPYIKQFILFLCKNHPSGLRQPGDARQAQG